MILENKFQLHKVVASYKCIFIHPLVTSNYSLYFYMPRWLYFVFLIKTTFPKKNYFPVKCFYLMWNINSNHRLVDFHHHHPLVKDLRLNVGVLSWYHLPKMKKNICFQWFQYKGFLMEKELCKDKGFLFVLTKFPQHNGKNMANF